MKVTEIKFMARHNKGNYEHEEVTLTAILDEKDFISDVMAELKVKAYQMFVFPQTGSIQKQEAPEIVEEKPTGIDHPAAIKTKEEVVKKPRKKAAPVEEKEPAKGDVVEGVEVPPVIEEEMEVVESPYKKSAAVKTVAYDLKNKDHRDRLAAYLNKEHPTWKSQPKEKLLAFSNGLTGKEFEDLSGNMLESFKEIVSSHFA